MKQGRNILTMRVINFMVRNRKRNSQGVARKLESYAVLARERKKKNVLAGNVGLPKNVRTNKHTILLA